MDWSWKWEACDVQVMIWKGKMWQVLVQPFK